MRGDGMDAGSGVRRAEPPRSLDELSALLRERRVEAGNPSFSELTRRVVGLRTARGVPARERTPGRVTVYDCFREGRRRLDVELVLDIVRALGAESSEVAVWRGWCTGLQPAAPASPLVPVRRELPPEPERFIGRRAELEQLREGDSPVLVTGMAGAGKTQLALRALRALVATGVVRETLLVDARASLPGTAPDARALVSSIARALGSSGDDPARDEARLVEVADELAERRVALLIDDVVDLAQVAPLVRAVRSPLVMVSRTSFAVPEGVRALELGPWDAEEGVAFLAALAGSERVASEPDAARDIVSLAGGLPLAAALMGARVAERPDWSLADHRDALTERLRGLHLDRALNESFALSYHALRPAARRALRLFAAQPCDALGVDALARLLDVPPEEAGALAGELVASHCAEPAGADRIGLHALVRAFALTASWDEDTPRTREEAIVRLTEEFVARAWVSVEALSPGHLSARWVERPERGIPEPEAAREWLTEELGAIVELGGAIRDARPALFVELTESIGIYLERQGMLRVARELFESAVDCAARTGDAALLASSHLLLGLVLLRQTDSRARRELEDAIAFGRACGRLRVVVSASNALAVVAAHAGEAAEALERFGEARAAARHGAPDMYGMLTDNFGVMHARLGRLEEALALHREAYEFHLARGAHPYAAGAIGNASDVQIRLGDVDGAVESAERALELVGDRADTTTGYARASLGMALLARGDVAAARACQLDVLEMAERIGDVVLGVETRNNLGFVEQRVDPDAARRWFDDALDRASRGELAFERSRALLGIAELEQSRGEFALARAAVAGALEGFPVGSVERERAERLRTALAA
ncbi:MAG: tetratricopeptide repeat protein [Protaetiibacter sp.]